jgi:hypothetical protein
MNYGKFFRLNQRTSKIEDGVAIYDYIDLPAYFEASESNKMSPKYPISIVFTEDSVLFRVHYSAYKIEKEWEQKLNYIYKVEKAYEEDFIKRNSKDRNNRYEIKKDIKHMEEVVLRLPYANDSTDELYQTIKEVYTSRYPFSLDNKTTLIYELIKKRYKIEGISSLEKDLYEKLHENMDGDSSYSTLWLMDIAKKENDISSINLFDKNDKIVVKFLRKLLLDFMFDLKHSDVFQTSKYYQAMYSGLMSNFYFSALMHKCEYYFYRDLINDVIRKKVSDEKTIKRHISKLYAEELFKAEELWINDIMSPSAEKYFEHKFLDEDKNNRDKTTDNNKIGFWEEIKKEIKKESQRYTFRNWNSWFASPEEEMRRVCFTMTDKDNVNHLCNAETIAEYLNDSENRLDEKLLIKKDNNNVEISKWFLKRFAYSDTLHFHIVKYANKFFFMTTGILLLLLFIFPNVLEMSFWTQEYYAPILICVLYVWFWAVWSAAKNDEIKNKSNIGENVLEKVRRQMIFKKVKAFLLTISSFLLILLLSPIAGYFISSMNEETPINTAIKLGTITIQIALIGFVGYYIYKKVYPLHWLSNMHLFFPKLIASIAAAWLSLAIGNELFGTFFDSIVSWSTCIWLSVIVFIFMMYEVNKLLPLESVLNKISRCLDVMVVSYVISLIVGLFIINFTGERFLERSGVLEGFFQDYVDQKVSKQVENRQYRLITYPSKSFSSNCIDTVNGKILIPVASGRDSVVNKRELEGKILLVKKNDKFFSDAKLLEGLESVHIVDTTKDAEIKPNHPIVTTWDLGNSKFFILRDFLIQFAFVAMFIGIFIQMIFEEKKITEM